MALVVAIGQLAPELVDSAAMTYFQSRIQITILDAEAPVPPAVQLLALEDGACDQSELQRKQKTSSSGRNKMSKTDI